MNISKTDSTNFGARFKMQGAGNMFSPKELSKMQEKAAKIGSKNDAIFIKFCDTKDKLAPSGHKILGIFKTPKSMELCNLSKEYTFAFKENAVKLPSFRLIMRYLSGLKKS